MAKKIPNKNASSSNGDKSNVHMQQWMNAFNDESGWPRVSLTVMQLDTIFPKKCSTSIASTLKDSDFLK